MANSLQPPPANTNRLDTRAYELKLSAYEKVSGLLVALLVLIGVAVVGLFIIWLTNRIFARPLAVPVILENIGVGNSGSDVGLGDSLEFDDARPEELLEDVQELQSTLPSTLTMIDAVIAERQAELAEVAISSDEPPGGATGHGSGASQGVGGEGDVPGVPRWQRWEMRFDEEIDLAEYARQLDFFGIELGVVGIDRQVTYVSNLSQVRPTVRRDSGDAETRLYMSWRSGSLKEADRQLLRRAGVDAHNAEILHFYPPEVENQMAHLEQQFAGRKAEEIRRTRFGVRSAGDGYEIYVIDQIAI